MSSSRSASTAAIRGWPVPWAFSIHLMFVSFPIACFTLALLTDLAYWRTSNLMWQYFSAWLLFAGLVFGAVAAVAGVVDLLIRREVRARRATWLYALGGVIVFALAIVNSLVHARDGWIAIVPQGLILSLVTVLVMILTAWLVCTMASRHDVGVSRYE